MIRRLLLLGLLLLNSSSVLKIQQGGNLNTGEVCLQSNRCKTKCCRRHPYYCESHCTEKAAEGSLCHMQKFFGLYNECPCQPNLTCAFSKKAKFFKLTYGRCKKVVKKKLSKRSIF